MKQLKEKVEKQRSIYKFLYFDIPQIVIIIFESIFLSCLWYYNVPMAVFNVIIAIIAISLFLILINSSFFIETVIKLLYFKLSLFFYNYKKINNLKFRAKIVLFTILFHVYLLIFLNIYINNL